MFGCLRVWVFVCLRVWVFECLRVCVFVCMSVFVCLSVCVFVCMGDTSFGREPREALLVARDERERERESFDREDC